MKNFVNIHNVCHSIKELLKYEKTPKFQVLNVSGDRCFSLFEIADKIKDYFASKYNEEIFIDHKFDTIGHKNQNIIVSHKRIESVINYQNILIDSIIYEQIDEYYRFFNAQ